MLQKILKKIKHPLLTNSLFLYLSNFADFFLIIIILPFVARVFGPAILGEVGLAQSIGLIFLVFLEFGFGVTATKIIASNDNISDDRLTIGQVLSYKLYMVPIVILASCFIMFLHPVFIKTPYLILISTADAIFQSFIPSWYFKGKQKFKELAFTKIFFRVLAFIMIYFSIKTPSDTYIYLALLASSSLLIALTQIFLILRDIGKINLCRWKSLRPILKPATYNFFITIMPTLFNNAGILILSLTANPIIMGYYYAVSKIHRAFNSLYTPIFETFFPYIVKVFKKNKHVAFKKMIVYNLSLFLLGLSFFIIIWFFSEKIIDFLLGKNFVSAKNYLRAFGLLLPLTIFSFIWGNQWMVILNNENKFMKISWISNFVGIAIMFMLIPKYSIFAIPVAIGFSELIKIFSLAILFAYDK